MRFSLFIASLLVASFITGRLCAQEDSAAQLTAKPNKCIALRKGQACYQTLNFYWRTPQRAITASLPRVNTGPYTAGRARARRPFSTNLSVNKASSFDSHTSGRYPGAAGFGGGLGIHLRPPRQQRLAAF